LLWVLALLINLESSPQVVAAQYSASAGATLHKFQTSDPAIAVQIESQGGHLIADYGSYRLYETPALTPEMLASPRSELRDHYNLILLHAGHLDTRTSPVQALRKNVGEFTGKKLHLVQFAGPVQTKWRDELLAAGVQIITHLPENTYLVYGDAQSLARVQALAAAPHVQWDGAYLDNYKINPSACNVDAQGQPREIGTDLFDIQLVADAGANSATLQLLDRLKLEPFKRESRVMQYLNLVVRLNPNDLNQLAAQPEVVAILPFYTRKKFCERQDEIATGNLTGNVPTGPGYLAWLGSLGFTTAQFTNFIVDLTDSGVDDGTTSPNHFGLYAGGNATNASRVAYNRLVGTPNTGSTLQGCDGHGTLNAHIVGGYDDFAGFPFADTNGFHYGLGVCPFVSIGSSVIFDPLDYTFPDFTNLQSQAYQSGARVSNNSWGGSKSGGVYDSEAQVYDMLVRDAQPTGAANAAPGNQGMVIVFSAGNDGPSAESVDTPGTAKNVISVGAGENVQAFGGADGSGVGDSDADSANDIVFFSSEGPCADGRSKPDLVAPGTHVSGGVFQATNDFADYPDGLADACFTGSGVAGGPSGSYWPLGQEFYTASDGTSHSAPCVSGACALVLQYFFNTWSNLPSPAMTKAYLLNSARYLNGAYANDTLPSPAQGMGELNLGMAFDGVPRILRDQIATDAFASSGQVRNFNANIYNTNQPLRVTLAWTDAPGSLSGNAYNNNLDLVVTIGTNVYKGNVFSGADSVTGGAADVKNNVESVFLPAGVSGKFSVVVAGTSINSIGVPNSNNALGQDFALVVYNAALVPTPNLVPAGTVLVAESCAPTNGAIDPGETVTLNFALQNIGTGIASNVVAALLPGSDVFSPSAPQAYGAMTNGAAAVSRPFTFMAGGVCGGTINATLQVQDGSGNTHDLDFTLQLGKLASIPIFAENFDGVTAPALPSGWTNTHYGGAAAWVTTNKAHDTAPNAAFASDPPTVGLSELISPAITIVSTNTQLTFRNDYNLEADGSNGALGYDGGVLEIQIGNGAFSDILSAGGSFVTGAYNRTLNMGLGNPLSGRQAWSGSSGGFITTTVNLPAAAAGQNVRFKWRCGTDSTVGSAGWYVDTVSVNYSTYTCCGDTAELVVTQAVAPVPALAGTNLNFNILVTNLGPMTASNVTVTDTLPLGAAFASATPGYVTNAGTLTWNLGDLANGAGTLLTLVVIPAADGPLTNAVTAYSSTYDSDTNDSTSITNLNVYYPSVITAGPGDQAVVAGADVAFDVSAAGSLPLNYQWYFNSAILPGSTSSELDLFGVTTNQSGAYTVVVSNPANTVTSAVANLIVETPPVFITVPSNQTLCLGTNVTLSVIAAGQLLGYQWFLNGTNLPGATANLLTLTNFQPDQAGDYTIVVSNLAGSISSDAQLAICLPAVTLNYSGGNFSVSVPSQIGWNYTLQYNDDLTTSNWISLVPSTPGTGGVLILTDPAPSPTARFYRVICN